VIINLGIQGRASNKKIHLERTMVLGLAMLQSLAKNSVSFVELKTITILNLWVKQGIFIKR
jgi:hypothetical protein